MIEIPLWLLITLSCLALPVVFTFCFFIVVIIANVISATVEHFQVRKETSKYLEEQRENEKL